MEFQENRKKLNSKPPPKTLHHPNQAYLNIQSSKSGKSLKEEKSEEVCEKTEPFTKEADENLTVNNKDLMLKKANKTSNIANSQIFQKSAEVESLNMRRLNNSMTVEGDTISTNEEKPRVMLEMHNLSQEPGKNISHDINTSTNQSSNSNQTITSLSDFNEVDFNRLKTEADKGVDIAQYTLGRYFAQGVETNKSWENAFYYFELAANQDYAPALFSLGRLFQLGRGCRRSFKKAMSYYRLAAQHGSVKANYYIGYLYANGLEIEKSKEKAATYFQLVADEGCPLAQSQLAICYQLSDTNEKNLELAEKYHTLAIQNGCKKAEVFLEKLKQFESLRKNANLGSADAQLELGKWYNEGKWIKKSLLEACRYYKLAADQGNKNIQARVGEHFEQIGTAMEGAEECAIYYFEKAADQGHINSIIHMFECYHYGRMVEESQEKALKYLKMGADAEIPECQFQLGLYYMRGYGNLNKSTVEAFKYFKLADQQGHSWAQRCLCPRILHPSAKEINIEPYLLDKKITTLESILTSHGHDPCFIEINDFSEKEAVVIRDAMIENSQLTIMCSKREISKILYVFELAGYTLKDLEYREIVNPSTLQESYGCVFIGNDLKNFKPKRQL